MSYSTSIFSSVRQSPSVRPSVRPSTLPSSHDDQSQVWAGNTNFAQTCNLGYSRLTLKIGIIELDYLIWLFYLQLYEIRLVRAINRFSWYRKYWSLTLTSKVILAIWPIIRGNVVCPRNRFYRVWTRITKFAANMHLEILLTGIEYRGHWHWPSRSFGQLVTGFPETAFNVAILCWSRPTKRCYTSQCALVFIVTIGAVDNCRWKLSEPSPFFGFTIPGSSGQQIPRIAISDWGPTLLAWLRNHIPLP